MNLSRISNHTVQEMLPHYSKGNALGLSLPVLLQYTFFCLYQNIALLKTAVAMHQSFEPPRRKTNNVVSNQVRHKPACTVTEKS